MPSYIVRLETPKGPRYLEWSTIPDAPTSRGMSLERFREWYRQRHGERGMETLQERLARADVNGTSCVEPTSTEDMLSCNRAGPRGEDLTLAEIVSEFCD